MWNNSEQKKRKKKERKGEGTKKTGQKLNETEVRVSWLVSIVSMKYGFRGCESLTPDTRSRIAFDVSAARRRPREEGAPLAKVIGSTSNRIDWLALKCPLAALAPATGVLLFRRVTHRHPTLCGRGCDRDWRLFEGERTLTPHGRTVERQFCRSIDDHRRFVVVLFRRIVKMVFLDFFL